MLSNEVLGRGGPDHFLLNPPRQPKKEIGDYVESQGILVPRRFSTLRDALSSGKPFLARSEHPQDYNGASDLFPTIQIDQKVLDEAGKLNERNEKGVRDDYRGGASISDSELFLRLISDFQRGNLTQAQFESSLTLIYADEALRYCSLLGVSSSEFISQTSFSYWEIIPGFNRSIIADSSIPDRYHIVTHITPSNPGVAGYTIVEDGKIVQDQSWNLPDLKKDIPPLIDLYESVRRLSKFDRKHCPIMEVQTSGKDNYFLQYHRAVDFRAADFTLTRDPEDGEIEASFVRGATPKNGLVLEMNMHSTYDREFPVKEEEAGYDYTHYLYREIMVRRRILNVVKAGSLWDVSDFLAEKPHLTVSELFKSPICVSVGTEDRDNWINKFAESDENRKYPIRKFRIRIVSDGRKAYIKLLDSL